MPTDTSHHLILASKVLGQPDGGPRLLITGGVHGDEFEPMAAVRALARHVAQIPIRGQLTLVPVVNEAAFRRKHRCAGDGLDLARTCPGRPDGSITERTAYALSALIQKSDFYIDLHTGGTELAVWPMSGYMMHEDVDVLDQQRRMARAFNLPLVWGTDARLNGRSLSVARDAKVPAIYAEYLGQATCHADGVQAYIDGCLNVMASLNMIDRTLPASRVVHTIEDTRENAGYMQIQNPSPVEGFFEPLVQLGAEVQPGQTLGIVWDILGEDPRTVSVTQRGIVLTLHTFSRVDQGETLAVIAEMV